jgi:putative phosphoesterase
VLRLSCNPHLRLRYDAAVILGVLSDTHGRASTAAAGLERLRQLGADYVLHCGDVGDGVLPLLPAGASAFVIGNTDYDPEAMAAEAELFDVRALGIGATLDVGGVTIAVTHGDDPRRLRELLVNPRVKYLFTGHSHVAHDRREGAVRWINPGALHRAARKTVATLDLTTDELRYHEIRDA